MRRSQPVSRMRTRPGSGGAPGAATVVLNFPKGGPLAEAFLALGCTISAFAEARASGTLEYAAIAISDFRSMAKDVHAAMRIGRAVAAARVPHVYWNREGPSYFGEKRWRLSLLRYCSRMDAYATHTLQDCGNFAADLIYLPNAARPEYLRMNGVPLEALRDPRGYRYEVSFFGNLDAARYPEMAPRVDFLAALAPRLARHGIALELQPIPATIADQVALIQESRINLSVQTGADNRFRRGARYRPRGWGLSERCFGVPAAGGFLLSDWRFHAADDFVPGTEWASFSDLDDCVERVRYYLAHFDESRAIAEAARRRVVAQHGYVHRAQRLLAYADAWRAARGIPSTAEGSCRSADSSGQEVSDDRS